MANHGHLNRAWYELLEHTGKLLEGRKEDEMAPSYPDHGGLSSGEVTPMAVVAGNDQRPSPKDDSMQQASGDGEARQSEASC